MEQEEKFAEGKKNWKKWFRKENLMVLILGGILLFVIALPVEEQSSASDTSHNQNSLLTLSSLDGDSTGESNESFTMSAVQTGDTDQEYALYLEEKLRNALGKVDGVGKVDVMITLKSSRELVVEKEQPILRSTTSESDSQGGKREAVEMDSQENTVYRTDGSASEPYVIKTLVPEVEGVLVVAEGVGTGTVSHSIVEIVQALFGVEAHKVKVVKRNP